MNVNLFMGLNVKKSCPLPVVDSQISKAAQENEPAYEKFKEIMGNIKKIELAQNSKKTENPAAYPELSEANDCAGADKALAKNEINEIIRFDNSENKSLSLRRLKNIDEKLYELISFIILANSPDVEKLDNLTIRINGGRVTVSAGVKEIVINSSFFGSLGENIAASIEQSLKSISAYFEDSMTQSGELNSNKTIKDVLTDFIFDALSKNSGIREITGGPPGKTGEPLQQEPENILEQNEGINSPSVYESGNSNANQNGRISSLEQAINRLFNQLDIPEDLIDVKIASIIGGLKPDSEELELGKQDFLNLAKKITVELSQLSKKFTLNLEELITKIQTGSSGKFELNNHLVKSLRNTDVLEFYTDKFLKPSIFQAAGDAGISNSGAVSSNPIIEKTAINLADVIMQISSRIITKDGPVIRQLEIMLRPESLGAIRIKVEAAGDGVNIKIQTQYSHTEEIISSNLDMLKNNLSEKGVLLKDLSVFMDLNTGTKEKSFEGFSGFGNEFNRGSSPKQNPEADVIIKNNASKDLSETGAADNTDIDALSDEYKDIYGVDIVA